MRLMIAGTGSGCGKTTVTCALLAALKKQGRNIVSFKCGPDYVDPTFHRRATEVDCFNLDSYLMGCQGVLESLRFHSRSRDIAVVEGVMGFYDGIGRGSEASSHYLSRITETPVVLVVNTKGKSLSLCAEIEGFRRFENNNIVAVILNRTKPETYLFYKAMIEDVAGLQVLGYLPDLPDASIESRHLGLVPAGEIADLKKRLDVLGDAARRTFNFDALFRIAAKAPPIECPDDIRTAERQNRQVRIYVADDDAFCFHYADNHRILEYFGAELQFFSPLNDRTIFDDAGGLVFWGGYPELHAAKLAANVSLMQCIRNKYRQGLPIYAECGGFMYMNERLVDLQGDEHGMLGLVEGKTFMTDRLQKFGYAELTANKDNMLCKAGDKIRAHSFHYSRSTNGENAFTAVRAGKEESYPCIVAANNLFAGYPHLHFAGNRNFAANFVHACRKYKESR